jgi:hypothetical protein
MPFVRIVVEGEVYSFFSSRKEYTIRQYNWTIHVHDQTMRGVARQGDNDKHQCDICWANARKQ